MILLPLVFLGRTLDLSVISQVFCHCTSGSQPRGVHSAILTNIRIGQKCILITNTLAYLKYEKSRFLHFRCIFIKHFTVVINGCSKLHIPENTTFLTKAPVSSAYVTYGACTIKHYEFEIYRFRSKLACLSKPMCL